MSDGFDYKGIDTSDLPDEHEHTHLHPGIEPVTHTHSYPHPRPGPKSCHAARGHTHADGITHYHPHADACTHADRLPRHGVI